MSESSSAKIQVLETARKRRAASHIRTGKRKDVAENQLELFQRESDPACHAVRNRLSQLGLDYILRNVRLGDALKNEQLAQTGGHVEVPFFVDHRSGTKLYGAAAIIEYLDHEYGQRTRNVIVKRFNKLGSILQENADQVAWAIRAPLEQVGKIREDAREMATTLSKSVRTLRRAIREQR